MKISQTTDKLRLTLDEIKQGDIVVVYSQEESRLLLKNTANALVEIANKDDLTGFEEEISSKVEKGELDTKQDKLTVGNGIKIEKNDDDETVISVTIDSSLVKIVETLPATDIDPNKIYVLIVSDTTKTNTYSEYIYLEDIKEWEKIGEVTTDVDLSEYIKTADADKKYMKITNGGATISFSNSGAMQNFADNGQAFNAIRKVSTAQTITGKEYNAGSFGVKSDGTTAFSHKIYNTYDEKTGASTGARNTAVLSFSGPSGLRYAVNTGSANDVTEAMYRYVGVIDSPEENQKVYSAKQVDALIKALQDQIDELKKS